MNRDEGKRVRRSLLMALLSIVLLINVFYLYDCMKNHSDLLCAVFLGINILTIAVVFCIFALQALIDTDEVPIVGLMASLLVAIMGTNIASVWIVAFVITFSHDSTINIKVAFFSSFLILAIYIYYVFVRDHF